MARIVPIAAFFSIGFGLAGEGETCGGFNESTAAPFPDCASGFACQETCEASIPGACNSCVAVALEGEACEGFNESTGEQLFLDCDDGLACRENENEASIPGAGGRCVYAEEGEACEGFDESTGKPFPSCGEGLACEEIDEVSIPGAGSTCVPGAARALAGLSAAASLLIMLEF